MIYNQVLKDILMEYEQKRDKAMYNQRIKVKKVYKKVPRIKKIDEEIWQIGLSMSKSIIGNPENYKEGLQRAKEEMEKLKMERAYLLTENNIPLDYLDINMNA